MRSNKQIEAEYQAAAKALEKSERRRAQAAADLKAGAISNSDWHDEWGRHDKVSQRYDAAADARSDMVGSAGQTSLEYWGQQ